MTEGVRRAERASVWNARAGSPLVPHCVAKIAVAEKGLFLATQAQREALRLQPSNRLYRRNLMNLLTVDYESFNRSEPR